LDSYFLMILVCCNNELNCFVACSLLGTMRYFKVLTLQLQRLKQCSQDMRKLSSDYQIRDFGPIHVHYEVLSNACFKYDQIAEKLEDVS
jgi:hypothetical protein